MFQQNAAFQQPQQQSFENQVYTDANQIQNQRNMYATQNTNFSTFVNGNNAYNRDASQVAGQSDPFTVLRMVLENRQMDRRDIQEILAAVAILKRHNVMNLISLAEDHSTNGGADGFMQRSPSQMSPRKFGKSDLIQRLYQSRDASEFYINSSQGEQKGEYGEMPDSLKDFKSSKEFYVSSSL